MQEENPGRATPFALTHSIFWPVTMRLDIHAAILLAAPRRTEALLMIEAAWSEDQTILHEALSAPDGFVETHPCTGARRLRFAAEGAVRIEYSASIDNG